MPQLDITDLLLRDLVEGIGPLVEAITQWDLQREGLTVRVIPRQHVYAEILLKRLRGAGIDVDDDAPQGIADRLVAYLLEGNVLGAYEPSTEELLVVRENVRGSNLGGLALIVAHELVHRGQHVRHGHLFERVDDAVRELYACSMRGGFRPRELKRAIDRIMPTMTLLESHAHHIQSLLAQSALKHGHIERHVGPSALLLRLLARHKLLQYTRGVPVVAAAMRSDQLDNLFLSASSPGQHASSVQTPA